MNPMVPLRFKLDEPMLIKAAKLNASRYDIRIFLVILSAALLTFGFFLYQSHHRNLEWFIVHVLMSLAALFAGCSVFLLRAIALPIQVRKNLRQQKALAEEIQLSWTDDEFCLAAGKSQTVMPFTDLHGFRASGDVILLYRTDLLYNLVPVAALGGSGLHEAFIQCLVGAGVRRL
jgi:hypothetical protein